MQDFRAKSDSDSDSWFLFHQKMAWFQNRASLVCTQTTKVQELNSGTEAPFSIFISNIFRSVKSKIIAFCYKPYLNFSRNEQYYLWKSGMGPLFSNLLPEPSDPLWVSICTIYQTYCAVSKLQETCVEERIVLRETYVTTLPEHGFHSCP